MTPLSTRAMKFVRADLERLPVNRYRARVQLERDSGERFSGTAEELVSELADLRCTAAAAVEALRGALGLDPQSLILHDVDNFEAFGRDAVIVSLTARYKEQVLPLMGFCLKGSDPFRAAAVAVLNATNRVLGVG